MRLSRGRSAKGAPRVGLFGLLGAGNIGNDASMEAVLSYLRDAHPDAVIDVMTSGADRIRAEYGLPAIPLHWHQKYERQDWRSRARQGAAWRGGAGHAPGSGAVAAGAKVFGMGLGLVIDAMRTAAWVRRHEVVIVPGAGVLETSMHLRPWEDPYAMFLLCASSRLCRVKVALVCVGASPMKQRLTRWLYTRAARMAYYRSYRDNMSHDAMRRQGVDFGQDRVFRDLVFGFSPVGADPGDPQLVGVGVVAYYGTNDDRGQADQLNAVYLAGMKGFLRWLIDDGRRVRLFVGDTNGSDDSVARELMADSRCYRPDLGPTWVTVAATRTWTELSEAMAPVGSVVAGRYHNVLCALKLGKPTIAIGYSGKHAALMADLGLAEFCEPARSLTAERLIEQFTQLQKRSAEVRQVIAVKNEENARLLDEQFTQLTAALFTVTE